MQLASNKFSSNEYAPYAASSLLLCVINTFHRILCSLQLLNAVICIRTIFLQINLQIFEDLDLGRLDESFEFPRRRTDGLFDELMSYRMKNWNFSFFFFFFFIEVIDNSERQSLFLSKKVILRIRASCNSLCEGRWRRLAGGKSWHEFSSVRN